MLQESLSTETPPETGRPEPPRPESFDWTPERGLLHRLVAGNYFYFLSAALMLLGCYELMHATELTREIFQRTLKTLLILQGYELLVIATALVIVWRFKVLDDAFSLLLVELLLLLDPTFFSNSFFTMLKSEDTMLSAQGILVNVACFGLVPLKLFILQRGLKLRLSGAGWASFLFAAAYACLVEGPLSRRVQLGHLAPATYHYLMDWGPLAFALLAPPLRRMVASASPAPDYISDARRKVLAAALLVVPLAIIFAHLIESARVHELNLYAFDFAPAALAAGVLLIRQANPRSPGGMRRLLFLCDACALAALLLSSKWLSPVLATGKPHAVLYAVDTVPAFPVAAFPLLVGGAGVAGLYGLFYYRFRHRPALWRLALLALGGAAAWAAGLGAVRGAAADSWLWLRQALAHASAAAGGAAHGLGRILLRVGRFLLGGLGWLMSGAGFVLRYFLELLQGILIVSLAWDLCRRKPRYPARACYLLAGGAAGLGLLRYGLQPTHLALAFCAVEFAILILARLRRGGRGWLVLAALQPLACLALSLTYENSVSAAVLPWWSRFTAAGWRDVDAAGLFLSGIFNRLGQALAVAAQYFLEISQALLIALLLYDHARKRPLLEPETRYSLAAVVGVAGLIRYGVAPAGWSIAVCGAEFALLLLAALLARRFAYGVIALAQAAVFVLISLNYENAFSQTVSRASDLFFAWLDLHPELILGVAWMGLLALAIRWRQQLTWMPLGLLSIWIAGGWLPGGRGHWIPELLQAVFILGLVLDHRFNAAPNQAGRFFITLLIVAAAMGRFADEPVAWAALVLAGEAIALLSAAILLGEAGYAVFALLAFAGLARIGWTSNSIQMSQGMRVITAALVFFAIGILITFNKARLLRRIAATPPQPAAPNPAPPRLQPVALMDEFKPAAQQEAEPVSTALEKVLPPPEELPLPLPPLAEAAAPADPAPPAAPEDEPASLESRHRLATVQLLFETEPALSLALRHELPGALLAQLESDGAALEATTQSVYLVKGEASAGQWNLIPMWLCYPADGKH